MRYFVFCTILATLIAVQPAAPTAAQSIGNLTVAPTRVVFEGRKRSEVLTLINSGAESATYRLSFIEMRMRADGRFERIEEGGDMTGVHSVTNMIRYAPRQIDLEPGQSQSIRILLRKPAELAEGEYRSHLLIQAIPKAGAGRSVENLTSGQNLGVNLSIVPGVTLPVIVRHGSLSATTALSDFSVTTAGAGGSKPELTFNIDRTGNRSVYGDLTATYFPSGRNNGVVVSQIRLLAVYVPNPYRTVTMPLTLPERVELSGGRISVTYSTPPSEGAVEMARGEVAVPN